MGRSTLGDIAAELRRLAEYAAERRAASRTSFVDHSAVLLAISEQLHGLASIAEHKQDRGSLDG